MLKIAIIDSGIDLNYKHFANSNGISVKEERGRIVLSDDINDSSGHGTACFSIIRRLGPEAEYYHIKVFQDRLRTKERVLIEAILAAIDNAPQIINVSLGILTERAKEQDSLHQVCMQAFDKGIIIVSASQNKNLSSYPALFSEVLTTIPGICKQQNGFHYCPTKWYITNSGPQVVDWLDNTRLVSGGTSFAAARLTATIARFMNNTGLKSAREVIKAFNNQSELCNCGDTCPRFVNLDASSRLMNLKTHSREAEKLRRLILNSFDKRFISDGHLILDPYSASTLVSLLSKLTDNDLYDLSLLEFTDINHLAKAIGG